MPGETELMIQLKTVKLHRVHKMNCGESRYGAGIVPSINRILYSRTIAPQVTTLQGSILGISPQEVSRSGLSSK